MTLQTHFSQDQCLMRTTLLWSILPDSGMDLDCFFYWTTKRWPIQLKGWSGSWFTSAPLSCQLDRAIQLMTSTFREFLSDQDLSPKWRWRRLSINHPTPCCQCPEIKGAEHARFKHEAEDLRLFKEYSKQACQYECAIEKCKDICGCIPWDFPRTDEEYNSAPVCDLAGNHCFNRLLKKVF